MMVCLKCVGWMERGGQKIIRRNCVCVSVCGGVIGGVCGIGWKVGHGVICEAPGASY